MIFVVPDVLLLALLLATAFAVARLSNLIAVVMLLGLYSLLMALVWVVLDAVDVAFTEAAVGAGITTILMLSGVALTGAEEKPRKRQRFSWASLAIVLATGAALIYATSDMPHLGDPDAPIHRHVAPRYIEDSPREIGIPNLVTAVLASYRGYDTLGEIVVVFTAGVSVLVLLGAASRRREDEESPEDEA
jgi:multicomponent Na+:H+ antiporter subunit B